MAAAAHADDPFRDPTLVAPSSPQHVDATDDMTSPIDVPDTLAVGRNASLTLATDSLVVLGTTGISATSNTGSQFHR
jgi:sphingosine kinase